MEDIDPVEVIERFNELELRPALARLQRRLAKRLASVAEREFSSLERQHAFARAVNFALDRLGAALSCERGQFCRLAVHRNRDSLGIINFQSNRPGPTHGSTKVPPAARLNVVPHPNRRPGGGYRTPATKKVRPE